MLAVPNGKTPKLLRDKAMIELLYSTGIMVEELVGLKVGDINTELGYLQCHFEGNQNAYPLDRQAQKAMNAYLRSGRDKLLKGTESDILFPNISGIRTIKSGATSFMGVALIMSRPFGNIGIKTEETKRTEVPD